jgi:MHS family proline/betaine transporter-like MFS transporter
MAVNLAKKAKLLGIFINIVEWYDCALYIYLSSIISDLFFPNGDKLVSLICSYLIFAIGFVARPIGSWVFGYIGDYHSRKKAMTWSLILMFIPSLLMLIIPTYQKIGILGPIAIVIIRLFQGVAVGGNYGGSFVFAIEHAAIGKRGVTGGWSSSGVFFGFLLGSLVCSILTSIMDKGELYDFGWRIPYLLSVISLILAFYLISSFPNIKQPQKEVKSTSLFKSTAILLSSNLTDIIRAISLICLDGIGIYLLFFFYKIYLELIGIDLQKIYLIHTMGMIIMISLAVFFGWLSDKIGRKPILLMVAIGFIIAPYWGFNLVKANHEHAMLVQIIFSIIMGACYGSLPSFIVEMFPRAIRYSGSSLAFNLTMCIFGGTSIIIALWLLKLTNNINYVALYLGIVGVIAIAGLIGTKDKYQDPID